MSRLSGLKRQKREAWRVDQNNPDASAICDGCGFLVNYSHLRKQMDYRGGSVPVWTGTWVCATCQDVPNPFYSKLVLAPDPVPVDHPRSPSPSSIANSGFGYLVTESGGDFLVNENDTWNWGWIATQDSPV